MAIQNDKLERLKKRLETVEAKIKALNAERAAIKEEITATENAQIIELIRNATPGGETSDLAADFAAFMRERGAQANQGQANEAAASGEAK